MPDKLYMEHRASALHMRLPQGIGEQVIIDNTNKFADYASEYATAYVNSLDSDRDRRDVIITDMALEDAPDGGYSYYWYGFVDGGVGENGRFAWSVCNDTSGERSPDIVSIPFGLFIE